MRWDCITLTWIQPLGRQRHLAIIALFVILCSSWALSQTPREFHRTLATSIAKPVSLNIELFEGDLEIAYRQEGEVSVSASGQMPETNVPADFLASLLSVTRVGNQIEIRQQHSIDTSATRIEIAYRIDVPYRTEVHSFVKSGKQTITGIMGPVSAEVNNGDLKVSYVSKAVVAHTTAGNLELQVIGEHVEASTHRGNISCSRAAKALALKRGTAIYH